MLMVIAYVPLIYALYEVFKAKQEKLDFNTKIFIFFVNLSCSLAITIIALSHLSTGNGFDIITYSLATLGDIVILTLGAQLIVIHTPTRLRYIFSIVFCFFS